VQALFVKRQIFCKKIFFENLIENTAVLMMAIRMHVMFLYHPETPSGWWWTERVLHNLNLFHVVNLIIRFCIRGFAGKVVQVVQVV
jgi:hypothetical protein